MFKGSMVALVTPMHEDGTIDKKSLQDLLEWHIESNTTAIIVAGSTGEAATLDHEEQNELISFVVKHVAKRIPVIAGTGTNSTRTTLKLSQNAKQARADACLIVTPYYNKPTQKGLYQHYQFIASQLDLPIILYNVPARTACDMLPETIVELSKINNIIGVKEATGKVERAQQILQHVEKDFAVYSGDDATGLELMSQGATGVISVTANIAPGKMALMCKAILEGNRLLAEKLNEELMPLHTRLFVESNPIPVKWALQETGKIEAGIRLPLLPLDQQFHQQVKEAMQIAGVVQFEGVTQ